MNVESTKQTLSCRHGWNHECWTYYDKCNKKE